MSRREATQTAIMRSVECLAAENGLENISIRDILARAGQKNESALQYHFKNLSGLLASIRRARAPGCPELKCFRVRSRRRGIQHCA